MATNLFAAAKTIAPAKPAAKKTKDEVQLPGLRDIALIDYLMKTCESVMKTLTTQVKTEAFELGYDEICISGKRKESFKGVDGNATGSIEMRKKTSAAALGEEEVNVLQRVGLQPTKSVTTQAMFGINPKYASDTKLLQKISDRLADLPEAGDLFVVQEEVSKYVVTDELLDAACAMKDKLPREVLQMLTTMAIKPRLGAKDEQIDIGQVFAEVQALLLPAADDATDLPVVKS